MREPERERCPLCPRVEVLPMPEPIPRPTRFLFEFAFLGARKLERFIAFPIGFRQSVLGIRPVNLMKVSGRMPNADRRSPIYCTNSSRCGTFFTMPRIE